MLSKNSFELSFLVFVKTFSFKKSCKRFLNKCAKTNAGFTLVEILVSFAVVAILSGVLLQMFIVSSKANRKAYEIDKINSVATDTVESFEYGIINSEDELEVFLKSLYGEDKVEIAEISDKTAFKVYFDGDSNIISFHDKGNAAFYAEFHIDEARDDEEIPPPSPTIDGIEKNVVPKMACSLNVDISDDIAGAAYKIAFEKNQSGKYHAIISKSSGIAVREDGKEEYIWNNPSQIEEADMEACVGKVAPVKLIIDGFDVLKQKVGQNAVSPIKFITYNNTEETDGFEVSIYIADHTNIGSGEFKEAIKIEPASGVVSYSFLEQYGIITNANRAISIKIFDAKSQNNVPAFETQISKRVEESR